MSDPRSLTNAVLLAAGVIFGIVLAVVGLRLLLLPLRLLLRSRRLLAARIGPLTLLLALFWTAAVIPAPFTFLWSWLLGVAQGILVDWPRQSSYLIQTLPQTCGGGTMRCATAIATLGSRFWFAVLDPAARSMQVPPGTALALGIFALAVSVASAWRVYGRDAGPGVDARGRVLPVVVLGLSFVAAFYLGIASILAIPVFAETVPDLAPIEAGMVSRMTQMTSADATLGGVSALAAERDALPASVSSPAGGGLPGVGVAPPAGAPATPKAILDDLWRDRTQTWDASFDTLRNAVDTFPRDSDDFIATARSFFEVSDLGHVDARATERHATVLANEYGLWIADYRTNIARCAAYLQQGIGRLRGDYATLSRIDPDQVLNGPGRVAPTTGLDDLAGRCGDLRPLARDYLLPRQGPTETLGPFGLASSWLLRTESPELALIVGLLGFGFFGALATSFIREFQGTPGNTLPSMGFILPALVRGIGAAILVFLLAKGGLAILTKGDATPNPYAIFFACFVAAVFSDDVWVWARNRQKSSLGAADGDAGQNCGPGGGGAGGDGPPQRNAGGDAGGAPAGGVSGR